MRTTAVATRAEACERRRASLSWTCRRSFVACRSSRTERTDRLASFALSMALFVFPWTHEVSERYCHGKTMSEVDGSGSGYASGGGNDAYNPNIQAGPDFNALAKAKLWDGKRADGACSLYADGEACRRALIEKYGEGKDQSTNYEEKANVSIGGRSGGRGSGAAASKDGETYRSRTTSLVEALRNAILLDPYDPNRPSAVESAQVEAKSWASTYAPGGSGSLGGSASKMYTVVDAFNGHVAANGAAPVRSRLKSYLIQNLDEVLNLLESNK